MKIDSTSSKIKYAVLLAFVTLCFSVSFFFYHKNEGDSSRRLLYFESMDESGCCIEERVLVNLMPHQGLDVSVRQFLEEALLGPTNHRLKTIVSPSTKLKACFIQGNVLYINMTKEVLFPNTDMTSDIRSGVGLLEKNIRVNFPSIERVEIFVDGNEVFEGDS